MYRVTFTLESLELRRLLAIAATFDIAGVQPAAFSQPQIHALFRNTATGAPLTDPSGEVFDVTAYLDTGTSEVLLSQETADALGIARASFNGQPIVFSDVGVAGTEDFGVSAPLYTSLAPFTPSADVNNAATYNSVYNQTFGPLRTEIALSPADDLIGPIDIVGMPGMQGKVIVIDPKPPSDPVNFDDVYAYVYNPGTAFHSTTQGSDPGIPPINRHIKLSYASFNRFTRISPSGAPGPTLKNNPIIGPNPVLKLTPGAAFDPTPPVTVANGSFSKSGSFLFDTGAAASFISRSMASGVHVHYKTGTYNTADPILLNDANQPLPNQFVIQLGGIGDSAGINAAGFFLSSLTIPTTEGQPIRFVNAPVLVADITVEDPLTHQTLTLDGDFGMNYLTASTNITGNGDSSAGAFDWVAFDQPNGLIGLQLPGAPAIPPGSIAGSLFNDSNANGVKESTETPLKSWKLFIDANHNGALDAAEKTAITDASGNYKFSSLPPGSYRVREVVNSGWRRTAPSAGYFDVTLASAQNLTAKNFGNTQKVLISGTVFNDANGDKIKNSTEKGLSGWRVFIDKDNDGIFDAGESSVLTDINGNWSFKTLSAGTYVVRIVQQSGWRRTTPTSGSFTITLAAGASSTGKLFGEKKL